MLDPLNLKTLKTPRRRTLPGKLMNMFNQPPQPRSPKENFRNVDPPSSPSNSEEETIPNSQVPNPPAQDHHMDFLQDLESMDQQNMTHMAASPKAFVDISMSHAEEESQTRKGKTKRKKEKNVDPNRAFVVLVKPSKVSKK
ncbi:hypothetical protein L7F22_026439 [Adiantum nelumboides]|nr:hypothetical protein [Adiantum nelumboides]